MLDSNVNKKAWQIRKKAAKNLNCKVLEVSWKECLRLAKPFNISAINNALVNCTIFGSMGEVIEYAKRTCSHPIFKVSEYKDLQMAADYFNRCMILGNGNFIAITN